MTKREREERESRVVAIFFPFMLTPGCQFSLAPLVARASDYSIWYDAQIGNVFTKKNIEPVFVEIPIRTL